MTLNSNFKRRVRARAAKTGESYTTALQHIRPGLHGRPDAEARPRVLTIAVHSWLKNDLQLTIETGEVLYTASWRAGFPTAIWFLKRRDRTVATFRRKAFASLRTCVVKMDGCEFTIRKKLSVTRACEIRGGQFDGAVLSVGLGGTEVRLEHRGALVAVAEAETLSMKDHHTVRLLATNDPSAETLTALMMVDLLIQKYEES